MINNSLPVRNIITVQEADDLINRLTKLISGLYKTNNSNSLESLLKSDEYSQISTYATENNLDLKDPKQLESLLKDITNDLQHRPLMSLHIPFSPSRSFVKDITKWLSVNGPGPIKIDINVDKDVMAGVMIDFKGKTFDHSFKESSITSRKLSQ